jgi:hypothetical protein
MFTTMGSWWLMSVTLTTWEAAIKRMEFKGSLGK